MSGSSSSSSSGGLGFLGALTLVFITLKLLGKIDWSWWWVLLPSWGILALVIFLAIVYGFGFLVRLGYVSARDYLNRDELKKREDALRKVIEKKCVEEDLWAHDPVYKGVLTDEEMARDPRSLWAHDHTKHLTQEELDRFYKNDLPRDKK